MSDDTASKQDELKEKQLWNEYQILRDEIKSADTLNYQIQGVLIAASVAILTTAFKETQLLTRLCIFFSINAVTFSAYRLLCGNRARIWRISTYIRTFLEPHLTYINWETRISAQRKQVTGGRAKDKLSSLVAKNEWLIIFLLNTASLVSAVISYFTYLQAGPGTAEILVAMLLAFIWLTFYTSSQEKCLRRGGETEQTFKAGWDAVARDEETHVS